MKAIMRARLIDGAIERGKMTISVINLGDNRGSAKDQEVATQPTSLVVVGIAVKKLNEIKRLIKEDNEIILKLELDATLSRVSDVKDAKINGIQIDFSEINAEASMLEKRKKQQHQDKSKGLHFLIQLCFALFVGLLLFGIIINMH